MDALKQLKDDIARKRKSLADKGIGRGKKYIKRGEIARLEAQQEEEQHEDVTTPTRTRLPSTSSLLSPSAVEDSPIFNVSRAEVIRRLREREEPIRLFGETDRDVCLRLRQIEILAPEVNKGMRNEFMDAMDRLNQEELEQLAKQQGDEGESLDLRIRDDDVTLDDVVKLAGELKDNDDRNQEIVLKILQFLMKEWGRELNSRSEAEKRSMQGRLARATYKQTEAYLHPLFRMLQKKKTSPDILQFLSHISLYLVQREYVKANDAYLQMAIGNAPWPIGVTMVGIHARTGREKIFAQQIAHVLNDETQRKYIQGVKRLMTFCQRKYENDPSKSVEFHGISSTR